MKNRKNLLKGLQYILFFALGVFIFWRYYKDQDFAQYKDFLQNNVNYWWIVVSFFIGILSHISRAIRWNMLIKPLGYHPRKVNSFLAVMVMYLINFILPRAGEVARCGVLTRYEKIPFAKLIGTVVVERISDFVALMFFAIIIVFSQLPVVGEFFEQHPDLKEGVLGYFTMQNLYIVIGVVALIVLLFFVFQKFVKNKIGGKLKEIINSFTDGIKTIRQLENKWAYIGHTFFIYLMWLGAMFVVFFSYGPTKGLSLQAGMMAFVMGGLAMVLPIQAGIGPWHFMVSQTLVIYGISLDPHGKFFAFLAHSSQNGMLIVFGFIALMILPAFNAAIATKNKSKQERQNDNNTENKAGNDQNTD